MKIKLHQQTIFNILKSNEKGAEDAGSIDHGRVLCGSGEEKTD